MAKRGPLFSDRYRYVPGVLEMLEIYRCRSSIEDDKLLSMVRRRDVIGRPGVPAFSILTRTYNTG